MNLNTILQWEANNMKKLQNLKLLPNRVKGVAIILVVITFFALIAGKFLFSDYHTVRLLIKNLLLVSLLLVSISRDKIEDELTLVLRLQSYAFAFIAGVVYAMVQPVANLLVEFLINNEAATFVELSITQVLFFMLLVQLSYFTFTKRMR
jgi:hypothetical protein